MFVGAFLPPAHLGRAKRLNETPTRYADPIIVLPLYRSPSTTDWTRFVIVCGVHPIVKELVLTVQRTKPKNISKELLKEIINDPKMHYHDLGRFANTFLLEFVFVMYR